ncbi:MAG TPA: mechanosensitive ion channel domain-containing protein [Myxococcota bacterium]|nr:mechanosensitive ion channel domain-containing protein [Myxococcota bacterium]
MPANANTTATTAVPPNQGNPGLLDAFNPGAIPGAIAWIIGAIVAVRLINRFVARMSKRVARHRLVFKQVGTLLAFSLYVVAFILALSGLFTLSSQALLALSGTVAVTVGFALKDVAASFFAGITILINRPFQVGDRINFGGYYGEVKEIGLRTVRLVTLDDNLVTIPTNKFLTDPVASANAGQLDCMVVTKFHVSPQADHDRAHEIVREAVLASKYLYLGKPMTVLISTLLTERGQSVVELTAKAYVYDAQHEKAFASDVTDRVLSAFRASGIRMIGDCLPEPLDNQPVLAA